MINFLDYSSEQLCELMINDPMIASKVSVSRSKATCTFEERRICVDAYSLYKKIKKENNVIENQKEINLQKYYLKHFQKSFRHRTVTDIYEMIKDDKNLWNAAVRHFSFSGSRVRSNHALTQRCQKAVIMWYEINNPTHSKLQKYIKIMESNNDS